MEKKKTTINYVMSHSKMPEIVLKNYKEFLKIANQGPNALGSFLETTWNLIKRDLLKKTDYEVLDKDLRIDTYSFQVLVSSTKKNKKLLTIIMPPLCQYTESRFITIVLEKSPQYFTCELSKSFNEAKPEDYYILGEWKYDEKKEKFEHKDNGRIENTSLKAYLEEIEKHTNKFG